MKLFLNLAIICRGSNLARLKFGLCICRLENPFKSLLLAPAGCQAGSDDIDIPVILSIFWRSVCNLDVDIWMWCHLLPTKSTDRKHGRCGKRKEQKCTYLIGKQPPPINMLNCHWTTEMMDKNRSPQSSYSTSCLELHLSKWGASTTSADKLIFISTMLPAWCGNNGQGNQVDNLFYLMFTVEESKQH
jgi:hypothetical protein